MELFLEKIQYKNYNQNVCGIYGSLMSCLTCSLAAQRFVAFCVSGTVGTKNFSIIKKSGLNEIQLFQDRNIQYILQQSTLKKFIYLHCASD
jgi:hypothetical protein